MPSELSPGVCVCVCVRASNLHHRDVSVQHREGQGCPVPTVRVHRRVLRGTRWDLGGTNRCHAPRRTLICLQLVESVYRHIQVGSSVNQHLHQSLIASCTRIHQRRHPLRQEGTEVRHRRRFSGGRAVITPSTRIRRHKTDDQHLVVHAVDPI